MAIEYKSHSLNVGMNDSCHEVLQQTYDYFANNHSLSILSEGWGDIISDKTLWADYRDHMMNGVDASERQQLESLMDNARVGILRESLSGITPISSLSVPTIRRLWPKIALKNAIITEVVKLPKFTVSYMLPYIFKDGEKYYLPESILIGGDAEKWNMGTVLYQGEICLADFTIGDDSNVQGAKKGFNLLEHLPDGTVASTSVGDSIDPDFSIIAVSIETTDLSNQKKVKWINGLNIVASLQASFFQPIKTYADADLEADGTPKTGAVATEDKLFGNIDFTTGILTLASAFDKIKAVKVRGRLSQEFNVRGESVSFDITTKDVTVGTGQHLSAPLPIEFMQDVMALYNIDGAAKIVDIMTTVFAQRLDNEIYAFLMASKDRMNGKYQRTFDCVPFKQFNGTPKQWREEIKDVFEYLAQEMRQDYFYNGGEFLIVGNPLDTALFPNLTWIYRGGSAGTSEAGRSGVNVDYTISAWSGMNNFTIVSSQTVPQGTLIMYFLSTLDEQMTYRYYPYSFNVEKGYTDPNFEQVPAIMMSKRHKLETFKDCMATVRVLNNRGDFNFVNNVEENKPLGKTLAEVNS